MQDQASRGTMTRNQAVFIGIGGMVGAGIFALLGEAGAIAKSAVWLSFLLAGGIAMLQGYSFAFLGKKYASESGLIGYISAGFGEASRTTSISSWMGWMSTVIVVAMVAVSFGDYAAATVTGGEASPTLIKVMATAIVVAAVLLNALGGGAAVARTQSIVIRLVLVVLFGLAVLTMLSADWSLLAPSTYPSFRAVVGSLALTFFAFLGFGVISFTARDLKDQRDLGPATYIALAITTLLYVVVALGVFGQLSPEQVTEAGPRAIALAAEPVLGAAGYWIVAVTAMLSTAGAVNSTLYPAQGLLGSLARQGVFPPWFGRSVGRLQIGLLLSGVLTLGFVWLFDLTAIASIGSAVALAIFLVISFGHYRIRHETGARAGMLVLGMATVVITLLGFAWSTLTTNPSSLIAFVVLLILAAVVDALWRFRRERPHHRGALTPQP